MSDLLIDTNVVSFFIKRHRLAEPYRPLLLGFDLAVSFMTVAELNEWAIAAKWGVGKMGRLRVSLAAYTVLLPDHEMCRQWADIRCRRRRRPISVSDAWIAASALCYDLALVTHNPDDFEGIPGLKVLTAGSAR